MARPNPASDDIPSCFTDTHGIITTTMNDLPGHQVKQVLGTVYGLTVRSRNWGAGLGGVAKSVVGGEIRVFTKLIYAARNEAVERMIGECMARGGNAIVAMRFDIVDMGGFSQICAYGTACVVEMIREEKEEPK
ncbi:putative heavy-metal-binding-domain-containing protein [Lipomyces kononenkoae]